MVAKLFSAQAPSEKMRLLDPGCGDGAFVEGVVRWCRNHGSPLPRIVGVELHPGRSREASQRFSGNESICIRTCDFLQSELAPFDFIIGNPPYVGITELGEDEKARFRARFATAVGRFDLYLLFWERALRLLKSGGRMVFITPEKFLTVESARPLRRLLAERVVPEVELVSEETFPGLTTYPTITTIEQRSSPTKTRLLLRDGSERMVRFTHRGDSLAVDMYGNGSTPECDIVLQDICDRISCGVATGADRHFVRRTASLPGELRQFAFPTISGRQLVPGEEGVDPVDSLLIPYDHRGRLLPLNHLDGFAPYLFERRESLLERTCTRRKPWYAFHETPLLHSIMRPKILCKDVTERPQFWVDMDGSIVPRHSVYYIVPLDEEIVFDLAEYLNGPEAGHWLMGHCQRVRKGFIRLQSTILKQLPVPKEFSCTVAAPLFAAADA